MSMILIWFIRFFLFLLPLSVDSFPFIRVSAQCLDERKLEFCCLLGHEKNVESLRSKCSQGFQNNPDCVEWCGTIEAITTCRVGTHDFELCETTDQFTNSEDVGLTEQQ